MTVAIVTGASRGVGKGIARVLGASGATVYCTGRSSGDSPTFPALGGTVEATAELVTESGGTGIPLVCDHTDDESVRAAFARVADEQERLDVLVNNVWGGYEPYHLGHHEEMAAPFWEQPATVWDGMFQAGVRAHYITSSLAVPLMVSPGGLIVTISFFVGSYPRAGDQVAYSVAKAADDRLAVAMANELRDRGIASVALYPGLVRTEAVMSAPDYWDLSNSESPEFVGRAVASLTADPDVLAYSGQVLVAAELARRYGFSDLDGKTPRSIRDEYGNDL